MSKEYKPEIGRNLFYEQLEAQSEGKFESNEDKILQAKIDALTKAQTVILEVCNLLEDIAEIYRAVLED